MSDRKLRPRTKEINYLEVVNYKSPVNSPQGREPPEDRRVALRVARNLRPRKVISYEEISPLHFIDANYGKYHPKEKIENVIKALQDDSDDEDEYKSLREKNVQNRLNILKTFGIDTEKTKMKTTPQKGTGRALGSTGTPKPKKNFPALRTIITRSSLEKSIIYTIKNVENMMDVDDDDEGEKLKMTDRLNVLKNMDTQQEGVRASC